MDPLQPVGPHYLKGFHDMSHHSFGFHDVPQDAFGNYNMGSRPYFESLQLIGIWGCLFSVFFLLILLVLGITRCCFPSSKQRKPSRHFVTLVLIWSAIACSITYFWLASYSVHKAAEEVDNFYQPYVAEASSLATLSSRLNASLPAELLAQLASIPDSQLYSNAVVSASKQVATVVNSSAKLSSDFPNMDASHSTHAAREASHWTAVGLTIFLGVIWLITCMLPFSRRPCVRWTYMILIFIALCFTSMQRGAAFGGIVGLSDFCQNVTGQTLILLDKYSSSNDHGVMTYYLTCSGAFPFGKTLDDSARALSSAMVNVTNIIAFLNSSGTSTALAQAYATEIIALQHTIDSAQSSLSCGAQFSHYTSAVDYTCNDLGRHSMAIFVLSFVTPILLFMSLIKAIISVPSARGCKDDAYELEESKPLLEKTYFYGQVNY